MKDYTALLSLLLEIRAILLRSNNDHVWMLGDPLGEARAMNDAAIATINAGESPDLKSLYGLFAPTMWLQEISIGNGWDEQFLVLAARFDSIYSELRDN